jgi:DNA polymerase III epsilon subunit-like protein
MITLDTETSGLNPELNGLLSLGAVEVETGEEFYGECRLYDDDMISEIALKINGFTEFSVRSYDKQSPQDLCLKFVEWSKQRKYGTLLSGQQVGSFDIPFLHRYAGSKSEFEKVFGYRSVDLHSIAYAIYRQSLSLDAILIKCGLEPEPKPHNALNGARLECKALKYLLNNISIITEQTYE